MMNAQQTRSMGANARAATVIATLPPPTTGMTHVTERMVAELTHRGRVSLVNLSAGGAARRRGWKVIRSLRQIWASLRIFAGRAGEGSLYLALNSGTAVILDVMLIAAARAHQRRIFVHHHSFRFIDSPSALLAALYWFGGHDVVDIVLCERMAEGLQQTYGRTDVRVVPNLAEIAVDASTLESSGPVKLGHLSNLSLEKGVGRTIEAFAHAWRSGLDVELHLAGPYATEDAREAVERALTTWPDTVFYYGGLYDQQKAAFYTSLDLFLYPTAYSVEAQPLVLLEALSAGVSVLTVDRGCVSGLAKSAVGDAVVICELREFPEVVRNAVLHMSRSGPGERASSRSSAMATAEAVAEQARTALTALVEEILLPVVHPVRQ